MEQVIEATSEKKMDRLKALAAFWAVFMVLIFTPALFCTSAVEGESLSDSFSLVSGVMQSFGAPDFLAYALQVPVALVAKILPVGTSTLLVPALFLPFDFLVAIVPMLICGLAELPYYRERKTKIDPDWYSKENEGVLVKARVGSYPLSRLFVFLAAVSVVSTIWILPNIRTPIADNWIGKVYIADSTGKLTPIDVKLNLKMFDPGYVTDRKPGVHGAAMHLEFSGNDVDKLKALGINDNFIEGRHNERTFYPNQLCEISKAVSLKDVSPYGRSLPYFIKNYLMEVSDNIAGGYTNDLGCPKTMHFGISSFEEAQFAINGPTEDHYLVAQLERDSRWSWIEKMRISSMFNASPREALEHSALGNPFGYR